MSDLDAIRARAEAMNRRPILLRAARDFAGGFEADAVREVLRLTGRGDLAGRIKATSRERTGRVAFSFPLFHELEPGFPVLLRASRLRFDFDGVFMQLMNDFAGTPMWSAWQDAAAVGAEDDGRCLALVFSWPRVRGCKRFCVLHNAATAAWTGTRVMRAVGDEVFAVETLPSLLHGLGVLAAGDTGEDTHAGSDDDD